jgi:phosphatidylglycerophosphate synthase
MSQTTLTKIKILLTAKIVAIVLLFLLTLLWHNSFSPTFVVSVLLVATFFAISTIADYILYNIIKKLNKHLEEIYEKYEKKI